MTTNQRQLTEGTVQTYISADIERLYEKDFLEGQTRTASRGFQEYTRLTKEQWNWVAPRLHHHYGYDPIIVRFYEDIIFQLQRELARYKAMVVALLHGPAAEEELEYRPGEPVRRPGEIVGKLKSVPMPGLPMTGYEI